MNAREAALDYYRRQQRRKSVCTSTDTPQTEEWASFFDLTADDSCTVSEPEGASASRAEPSTQSGVACSHPQEHVPQSQSSEVPEPVRRFFLSC